MEPIHYSKTNVSVETVQKTRDNDEHSRLIHENLSHAAGIKLDNK